MTPHRSYKTFSIFSLVLLLLCEFGLAFDWAGLKALESSRCTSTCRWHCSTHFHATSSSSWGRFANFLQFRVIVCIISHHVVSKTQKSVARCVLRVTFELHSVYCVFCSEKSIFNQRCSLVSNVFSMHPHKWDQRLIVCCLNLVLKVLDCSAVIYSWISHNWRAAVTRQMCSNRKKRNEPLINNEHNYIKK